MGMLPRDYSNDHYCIRLPVITERTATPWAGEIRSQPNAHDYRSVRDFGEQLVKSLAGVGVPRVVSRSL
jgi:hypothetical protein